MSIELRDTLRAKYGSRPSTPVETALPESRVGVTPEKAFVVQAKSGRTVITGPVREIAMANAGFTYLKGRFVEADKPNSNGALWTTADLELGQNTDERGAGAGGAVAGHRKVRRVQARLDAHAGAGVLGLLDGSGGTVFLPDSAGDLDRLTGLVAELQVAAGAPVRAAAARSDLSGGLAAASTLVRDVLRLATKLDRPPGLYLLRDVLLEYQLTHPSEARAELAALLEPLERNPDLLLTLDAYLAEDLDRRRTAAALHVHPNTLDYRLKRIVELTGLEPTTTTGLQLLAAASVTRRLLS